MEQFICRHCISDMALPEFLLWAAVLVGGTLYLLYLCFKNFRKARLIEDMPTSLIRSASQGFTELIGIARTYNEPLTSPLTNTHCLWWRYTIEKYQRRGKSSAWTTLESGTSSKPFYVDDTSGQCLVIHEGADLRPLHRRRWRGHQLLSTGRAERGSAFREVINTLNASILTSNFGIGRYRYTEALIKDGDPLYVLGHFESDASGQRTLTAEKLAGEILRAWKQDFGNLLEQYDSNDDGQLNDPEWARVRKAAKEAAHQTLREKSKQEIRHQISKPVEKGLPFLIGSEEQHHLSRRYRLGAVA